MFPGRVEQGIDQRFSLEDSQVIYRAKIRYTRNLIHRLVLPGFVESACHTAVLRNCFSGTLIRLKVIGVSDQGMASGSSTDLLRTELFQEYEISGIQKTTNERFSLDTGEVSPAERSLA